LALVTDYDTGLEGVDGIEPVTMDVVFEVLRRNVDRTRAVLQAVIPRLSESPSCDCAGALSHGPLDA
jgi:purine nucleoside phosphorylase